MTKVSFYHWKCFSTSVIVSVSVRWNAPLQSYLCRRSLSDVNSRYSETLRPVMSTRMSPVTTFMRGGRPPTPLGQENPVPCIEQVQRTGSCRDRGSVGGDVTGSEETMRPFILISSPFFTFWLVIAGHTGWIKLIKVASDCWFSCRADRPLNHFSSELSTTQDTLHWLDNRDGDGYSAGSQIPIITTNLNPTVY